MGPHRIALVTTELGMGGAEKCLATIAARLDRALFEPAVYSLAPPPVEGRDELVRLLAQAEIPAKFVGAAGSWQLPVVVGKLAAMLREQSPQLVQTFLFHANVVGAMAASRCDSPILVAGARVAQPRSWRLRSERWITRRAERIVCVSQAVADFYRDRARFPPERLIVIPNGVDVEKLNGSPPVGLDEMGVPAGAPAIVAVGRLDRQKGFDWLLEQAKSFLTRLADHHLVIVGDGGERSRLAAIVAGSDALRSRVHFAGWRPDIGGILRAAVLFVMTSRYEGMPNALLEAMAVGLPVVATRAEGVMEVLGDFASHQTIADRSGDEFCDAICRLRRDPALSRELGASNRERVQSHFSIDVMVRRYSDLYRSLIERSLKT